MWTRHTGYAALERTSVITQATVNCDSLAQALARSLHDLPEHCTGVEVIDADYHVLWKGTRDAALMMALK